MANVKISELSNLTTIVPATDILPIVSGAATSKVTVDVIVKQSLAAANYNIGIGTGIGNTVTAKVAISANTSTPALQITQSGTGNAILVEDNTSDASPFVVSDSGNVGIGLTAPTNLLTIKGTTVTDLPTYASEFITGGTWTSTGWTGNNTTGWVHTAGNTTPLSFSLLATVSTKYQITYTVSGTSPGYFSISFGGQNSTAISATGSTFTGAFGPTATTTQILQITPTTDFVGTVIFSIKAISSASIALINALDSNGNNRFELRTNSSSNNTFLGLNSGRYTTTGYNNTVIGTNSLQTNTTGYQNTAVGIFSLYTNTTGYNNTGIGASSLNSNVTGYSNTSLGVVSLYTNTTGYQNTAVGQGAMYSNTTGYWNSALGLNALYNNTTGNSNTAVGQGAIYSNTTGSNNVAIGNSALYSNGSGSTNVAVGAFAGYYFGLSSYTSNYNTTLSNGIYLGNLSRSSANGVTNETVIGYDSVGSGSNTVTLGGSSVVGTVIPYGNAYIGSGTLWQYAPAPTSIDTATTLTAAQLKTNIINTTGTSYTVILPIGADIDTAFAGVPKVDIGFDFHIVNTATGLITIQVGALGMTSLGNLSVATGTSAGFRLRRTAASTYILYRLF